MSDLRALTVRQPSADLIVAGVKHVENRSWPVPSTLSQWGKCDGCDARVPNVKPRDRHYHPTWHGSSTVTPDGPFPFRLGIHAAATFADGWVTADGLYGTYRLLHKPTGESAPWVPSSRLGVLLGTVEVTGCHHARDCFEYIRLSFGAHDSYCSRWAEPDTYHWTLTDPQPLDVPVPMRGMLGLWRLPEGVSA